MSERQLQERVSSLSDEQRSALLTAAIGDRQNRRHKPGRSFERLDYRFDVLAITEASVTSNDIA